MEQGERRCRDGQESGDEDGACREREDGPDVAIDADDDSDDDTRGQCAGRTRRPVRRDEGTATGALYRGLRRLERSDRDCETVSAWIGSTRDQTDQGPLENGFDRLPLPCASGGGLGVGGCLAPGKFDARYPQ